MKILLLISLAHFFFAGYAFREVEGDPMLKRILYSIAFLLFGSIIFVLYTVIRLSDITWTAFNRYVPLRFYFIFYFTKKYDNLNTDQLERANRMLRSAEGSRKLHDRVLVHKMKLILRRYNEKP